MKIEISVRSSYRVLKIHEDLEVISDLAELEFLVTGYIKQGLYYIAVGFDDTSYIYSGAIAVLVKCAKDLLDKDGELCLLEPNETVLSLLEAAGIDKVIKIYKSPKELPIRR
ncbi:STAS domain-containing protein [Fibrobacterota bacterium]